MNPKIKNEDEKSIIEVKFNILSMNDGDLIEVSLKWDVSNEEFKCYWCWEDKIIQEVLIDPSALLKASILIQQELKAKERSNIDYTYPIFNQIFCNGFNFYEKVLLELGVEDEICKKVLKYVSSNLEFQDAQKIENIKID